MLALRLAEGHPVNELQFADDVMARIRARGGAYHERAYLFVLATIEYLQSRLQVRRHVSRRRAGLGLPRLRPGAVRAAGAPRAGSLGRHPDRGLRPHGVHPGGRRVAGHPARRSRGRLRSRLPIRRCVRRCLRVAGSARRLSGVDRQRRGTWRRPEWPACQKCSHGTLIPLSDYGREGAPITYKAWVCTNPDCGFNLRIDNGEISFGRAIGQSYK